MQEFETVDSVLHAVWENSTEFGNYEEPPTVNAKGFFGNTPLFPAITWGSERAVTLLLQAGADPDMPCERGDTPLHHAVQMGQFGIARILVAHGANPEIRNDDGKRARDLCWEREWAGLFGVA